VWNDSWKIILQKYPGRPDVALLRSLERGKKISRDANVTFSARADGGGNDGDGDNEKNGTAKACGPVSGFISASHVGFHVGLFAMPPVYAWNCDRLAVISTRKM
jgi:hypothetical protein